MIGLGRAVTLIAFSLLPVLVASQTCDSHALSGVPGAVQYLNEGKDHIATCVDLAFRTIAHSPQDEAIRLLLEYLDYPRPFTTSEKRGFSFHAPTLDYRYPAVRELYGMGAVAEPALVNYIAQDQHQTNLRRNNALYTLILIQHGDVVRVIRMLNEQGMALNGTTAGTRLRLAAKDAVKWCTSQMRNKCEKALR